MKKTNVKVYRSSEAGMVGQVLYFWHERGNRSVWARNIFVFIEICLKEDYEEYQ